MWPPMKAEYMGRQSECINEKIRFTALNKFYITEPNKTKLNKCGFLKFTFFS